MLAYKLLTPGPLSTSETVKNAMQVDHCTWDDDYKTITQDIRQRLLKLANVDSEDYTSILMQGSGSFAVESVLTSVIKPQDTVLVAVNGAYGERIIDMLNYAGINFVVYRESYNKAIDPNTIRVLLENHQAINHVIIVHCETTSGILNDIQTIGQIVHSFNKNFIVDAMSSFGGMEFFMKDWHINYVISSANKCIQGVPGFGFVIANKKHLKNHKQFSRTLSLNLYAQWEAMEKDGKWRFTSPTHTVLAFQQALIELEQEGGPAARYQRYKQNNQVIREHLTSLGFQAYVSEQNQSPFISTYLLPTERFSFQDLYEAIKAGGFAIYPGKLTDIDTFRIGNIGEIYPEDVARLNQLFTQFLQEVNKHV